ncbi:transposase [Pseudomonas chlororaphis]|uniref:transposase n=1 Tax=Pseudomonas chlororaphis TaxID=587753 RepID=UPI0013304DBA|nr:transposase [Pseudomonas chlororaphis]
MINAWLDTADEISEEGTQNGKRLSQAYGALLKFISTEDWTGACHSSSAVLYIVLSEMGFTPKLIIGEVRAPAGTFDHSWIVVDGKIYDAAAGFPGEDGFDVGGPVFASIDLRTQQPTPNIFGVSPRGGLDEIASYVASVPLDEYVSGMPQGPTVWDIAKIVGANCGLKLKTSDLRRRYGKVTRSYILE